MADKELKPGAGGVTEATAPGSANYIPMTIDGNTRVVGSANLHKFLADGSVTLAKLADMATDSFLGRDTAGTGVPEVLGAAAARAILNVEDGATADMTGAEIKAAYEAEANTNAYTDAEKSKLAAVESGATADQSDAEIETAYNNQVAIVSQVDAEAGTSTTVGRWTPQRVKQAIDALAPAGGGSVGAAEIKTANYTVVVGDAGKTIAMNSAVATQYTLDETSWSNGQWIDLMSIGDGATTISGNGLNAAGQDTLVLRKGDRVRVTFFQSADPSWLVKYWEEITLAANQRSTRNAADNGYEARTDKSQIGATIVWDTTGGPWPIGVAEFPALVRGGDVILIPDSTASGVTVKIYKNGTEINGFATAQAVNYNAGAGVSIATTETFAAGDIITFEIVAATTIAHVLIRIPLTRTGD